MPEPKKTPDIELEKTPSRTRRPGTLERARRQARRLIDALRRGRGRGRGRR